MADILDEVLNDTKYESKLALFRKFFPIALAVTIIGALFMAGYSRYNNKIVAQNQQTGDSLVDAVNGKAQDRELIESSLSKLVTDNKNQQSELARLQIIINLIDNNNPHASMRAIEETIDNNKYGLITLSYARLIWLSLFLDSAEASDRENLKAREYFDFFDNSTKPFYANVMLIKALYYKKSGQVDAALKIIESIVNDPGTSSIIGELAGALKSSLKNNL